MASSTSSAAVSPKKPDVFISFKGEDTRFNFTSHLYDALRRNEIETYMDDDRLEKGDKVWSSNVKAIKESTLFLIVLSKSYASSTWCLNELTEIFECSKGQEYRIVPVFYEIDPSDVRHQKGSYGIAFEKHEQTNHNQQVLKWRDALTHVANLSGWDASVFEDEAKIIREIVEDVLKKLDQDVLKKLDQYMASPTSRDKFTLRFNKFLKKERKESIKRFAEMVSPTSSAVVSEKKDDVFISFRGEDTGLNFTSRLRAAFRLFATGNNLVSRFINKLVLWRICLVKSLLSIFSAENVVEANMQSNKISWDELRYLCWDERPVKPLPLTFSAENLVELNMQNNKKRKLWDGVQNLVNLKYIKLSYSKHLMELPDFSKALNLEEAFLSGCSSLRNVHPSILSLHKLEVLVLDWCKALTSLRSDIHLRSLRYLSLYKCSRLKEFSVTSENMITLNLVKTAVNELPSSICCMFKLESLNLSGCKRLRTLPSNLFVGLQSLRWLWLDDCCNVLELLDNANIVSSLDRLTINGVAMGKLPASVKHLSSLKFLLFNRCRRLQCLPELPPSIRALSATDCSSPETVSSVAIECTRFENYVKLDEYSVKAILAYVMVLITKSLSGLENYNPEYNPASVMYLESRVPKWFKYRTTHAGSITIDLSSAPLYMDWGLLFCFIFSPSQTKEMVLIRCTGYLQIINDQSVDEGDDDDDDANDNDNDNDICNVFYQMDATNFTVDHVFLCYIDDFCSIVRQNIKESRATDNSKLLYKMNVLLLDNDKKKWQKHCKEIKECGVCPTFVLEYQN